MYVGDKIREMRKSQKLTLVELSKKSGVQLATLSRIENSVMVGSVDSHIKIAKGLGVSISQLYRDVSEGAPVTPRKPADKIEVHVHSDKVVSEILASHVALKRMMPVLLKVEPGGRTKKEVNILGTEKFVYVIEGAVEMHIEDNSYSLSKNNSLYFDASISHFFKNTGKTPAKVLAVASPVSV